MDDKLKEFYGEIFKESVATNTVASVAGEAMSDDVVLDPAYFQGMRAANEAEIQKIRKYVQRMFKIPVYTDVNESNQHRSNHILFENGEYNYVSLNQGKRYKIPFEFLKENTVMLKISNKALQEIFNARKRQNYRISINEADAIRTLSNKIQYLYVATKENKNIKYKVTKGWC